MAQGKSKSFSGQTWQRRLVAGVVVWACVGVHAAPAAKNLSPAPQDPLALIVRTESVASAAVLASAARVGAQVAPQRTQLAQALAERGVAPASAQTRVAALTDAEVLRLAAALESSPAGASELIGSVVLASMAVLITDAMGYTKVYPFVVRAGTP